MSFLHPQPVRLHRMLVPALAATLIAGHAPACGLEGDDVSLQRGAMNWAFPDSLHVLGAVASAQHAGLLDRSRTAGAATSAGAAIDPFAAIRVTSMLWKLRARFAEAMPATPPPALAVVLLEPMLWSRIAAGANALALTVHVDGPATDDVVVVTEEAVVAAIVDGRMTAREALSLGLVRLYGSADRVARIRAWLEAIESPAGVTSGDAGMHDWLIRQIAGDARPHLRTNPGVG